MLFPSGWARYGDWPDLAACRAPTPLLVQYDEDDHLFTEAGMRAADARLAARIPASAARKIMSGSFTPVRTSLIWKCRRLLSPGLSNGWLAPPQLD
jgi:hypothetical protein